MRLIILAAGRGSRLAPLTDDLPKCLVPIQGRPILEWQLDAAQKAGIDDVVLVYGAPDDRFATYGVDLVQNPDFARTNMVRTLFCAREFFGDGFVVSYGDIVYRPSVLKALLACGAASGIVVDRAWQSYWEARFESVLDDAESLAVDPDGAISSIGQPVTRIEEIEAQYIGLVAFRRAGVTAVERAFQVAREDEVRGERPFGQNRSLDELYMTDLLQGMIDAGEMLTAVEIAGGWLEIDTLRDLELAQVMVSEGRLSE